MTSNVNINLHRNRINVCNCFIGLAVYPKHLFSICRRSLQFQLFILQKELRTGDSLQDKWLGTFSVPSQASFYFCLHFIFLTHSLQEKEKVEVGMGIYFCNCCNINDFVDITTLNVTKNRYKCSLQCKLCWQIAVA